LARSASAASLPPSGGLSGLAASAASANAGIETATDSMTAISFLTKEHTSRCVGERLLSSTHPAKGAIRRNGGPWTGRGAMAERVGPPYLHPCR
jgi:hypothetical protein